MIVKRVVMQQTWPLARYCSRMCRSCTE